jgi:hypothetical protein
LQPERKKKFPALGITDGPASLSVHPTQEETMTKRHMFVAAVAATLSLIASGETLARKGADDPAGHVRQGRGADDAPGHVRQGRGADDPAGHVRQGRGTDDPAGHVRQGRGTDDPAGHVRQGRGTDDPPGHNANDDRGRNRGGRGK